ncbi:hypothetical protein [Kochikohdavirus PBEF19]|uniref:Uncharacterized protein n=1 Tax=Enterococcus phage PBEF129 TaxID=2696337 RepID=A0A7T3JEE3_9CAUD|nr:hypothetical protein [Enterococcus phage PBEF129]
MNYNVTFIVRVCSNFISSSQTNQSFVNLMYLLTVYTFLTFSQTLGYTFINNLVSALARLYSGINLNVPPSILILDSPNSSISEMILLFSSSISSLILFCNSYNFL